ISPPELKMKLLTSLPLLIIPTMAADFTTYIGDTGIYKDADMTVVAMTADASGSTYLTGTLDWDVTKNHKTPLGAFVTKVDVDGKRVFFRVFGGAGSYTPTAISVDPFGNVYVAGTTNSGDLLLTNALQSQPGNNFIVKFSADGKQVLYSTY